jgi:hypothetical protein
MQKLCNSIKRPNLQIMRIEEEVQAKYIGNTFNKMMAENFPNLKRYLSKYRKPPGHQTDMTKIEPLHSIL